jgi:hypothetical protein
MYLHEDIFRIKQMMGLLLEQQQNISCDENGCYGRYLGPEFDNLKGDVAHQFSNSISQEVGKKLKQLYGNGQYSKVNFPQISMMTKGMGSGNVEYMVQIPFIRVQSKCESFTSFDHVGGWGHTPDLTKRKNELSSALLPNDQLDISDLKKTTEGLEEYWIQWRNKDLQKNCVSQKQTENTITGNSIRELREKIYKETTNISIDPNSVIIDMNNLTIKYSLGNVKIQRISIIYDNTGNLSSRLTNIRQKESSLKVIQQGLINDKELGNTEWAVIIL